MAHRSRLQGSSRADMVLQLGFVTSNHSGRARHKMVRKMLDDKKSRPGALPDDPDTAGGRNSKGGAHWTQLRVRRRLWTHFDVV